MAEWLTGTGRRAYFKRFFEITFLVQRESDTLFRFTVELTNNGPLGYFFHLRIPLSALLVVLVCGERVFPRDIVVSQSSDSGWHRFLTRFITPKRPPYDTLLRPYSHLNSHLVRSIAPGASFLIELDVELEGEKLTIPHQCFYEIDANDTKIQAHLYGITSNVVVLKP